MRITITSCVVCKEYIDVSTLKSIAPICSTCIADPLTSERVQHRIVALYEELIAHIANLSDTDSDRYHQVWLAQIELAQPPRLSADTNEAHKAAARRDLLNKRITHTLNKGDAVSKCMRIANDLKSTLTIQHAFALTTIERGTNE